MTLRESASTLVQKVVGDFGDKKRWRRNKARTAALPAPYRTATEAISRYLSYYGGITRGDLLMDMLEDLTDLFEQASLDGTSIRTIVGPDPVEFADEFLRNYDEGRWINKERSRLTKAIDEAVGQQPETGGHP